MKPYSNLPPPQREVQRLVDQFDNDEAVWRSLERRRRLRRKKRPGLTKAQHKALDLLEFAAKRPPEDCVGRRMPRRA